MTDLACEHALTVDHGGVLPCSTCAPEPGQASVADVTHRFHQLTVVRTVRDGTVSAVFAGPDGAEPPASSELEPFFHLADAVSAPPPSALQRLAAVWHVPALLVVVSYFAVAGLAR